GPERGPVVKKGATIPIAVPRLLLEGALQEVHVTPPRGGARVFVTSLGPPRELPEDRMQEPAEPHALSMSLRPDAVQAVVPVPRADQGQAVRPDGEAPVERARTMLEQRATLDGDRGLEVRLVLSRREGGPFQEG